MKFEDEDIPDTVSTLASQISAPAGILSTSGYLSLVNFHTLDRVCRVHGIVQDCP